jgi:glycerol-1-phosphate dehydrogenase [NAD(P)+]
MPFNQPVAVTVPTLLRIKPNASHRLGKYVAQCGWQHITVLLPSNLQSWYQQVVQPALESAGVTVLHRQDATSNTLDALSGLLNEIPAQTQAIVAIGGGRVIDAAKYVGHCLTLPVLSVPTAMSNDGFASPFSSVVMNGQRRSLPTVMPYGVVVDTCMVQKAPLALYFSGIGDLMSKATALPDWKLAYHQQGIPVNDFAWSLARTTFDRWMAFPDKSADNLEHMTVLANALLFSGLSMAIAGNSRPASGAEHLISHAYDAITVEKNLTPSLHGLQVGVATYAIAFLYHEALQQQVKATLTETGFFNALRDQPLDKAAFMQAIDMAPTIKSGFYSVLTPADARTAVHHFVQTDTILSQVLQS